MKYILLLYMFTTLNFPVIIEGQFDTCGYKIKKDKIGSTCST
jgi:hypothetical protein